MAAWSRVADPDRVRLRHKEGHVEIQRTPSGSFHVALVPDAVEGFRGRRTCETSFPIHLIQFLTEKVEYSWLCDEIARHEDPRYLSIVLKRQLFSYFEPSEFRGKRLLDFGCGSGGSSFTLAGLLHSTEIVGVELSEKCLEIARMIAAHRRLLNVRFVQSPDGESLPPNLGPFDFVMLSAVYEHLLPAERKVIMPKLWSVIRPGGVIFVNQTPHRYHPYEHHSTGLWLINYAPDRLAHWAARKFGRTPLSRSQDWREQLRGGIRGGTEKEIVRDLTRNDPGSAKILQPKQHGLRDRADYWLSCTNPKRYRRTKRLIAQLFRLSERYLGTIPSFNIDVVIRKEH